eukprot:221919-Prymnesium_polylepis.1
MNEPIAMPATARSTATLEEAFADEPALYGCADAMRSAGVDTLELAAELSLADLREVLPAANVGDRLR